MRGSQSGELAGKVAVITGAARGMGAQHARRFVEEGACVVASDIVSAAHYLGSPNSESRLVYRQLDVTDAQAWVETVDAAVSTFGQLDILVNNAGVITRGNAVEADVAEFRRTVDVDLTGAFLGMRAALPYLRQRPTSAVINIASIAGLVGWKNRVAYASAKAGLVGLTRTSALDFGADGVRANVVAPGSVKTAMTEGLRDFRQIPAGRMAETDEISELLVFLASDRSRFINGATITIDGGEIAGNNLRVDLHDSLAAERL